MTTQQLVHPTPQRLRAFLDGRLAPREMAELESHVAACDSCCRLLEKVPDDTLVQLARAAATAGFRAQGSTLPSAALPPGIPAELENHPRYRVLRLIGCGGMGAVYKADHRLMERLVAPANPLGIRLAVNPIAAKRRPSGAGRLSPRAIVLSTLACGIALALIILAFPLANWLFQPAIQPLPRKALIVLPLQGLWLPDYNKVKFALEQKGIQVVSASTTKEPIELYQLQSPLYQPPRPVADVVIDDTVRAQDYGAIVFTGYTIDPYLPAASHGPQIRRLLDEAKQSGRLLTAVCRGQILLLLHGELRGKRVAHSNYADEHYQPCGAIDSPSPVEQVGQCITVGSDENAFLFADAIDQALREGSQKQ